MPGNAAGGTIEAIRNVGADIHFVDTDLGSDAVIERCEEVLAGHPDRYYRPNQYENPDNPGTREGTTAIDDDPSRLKMEPIRWSDGQRTAPLDYRPPLAAGITRTWLSGPTTVSSSAVSFPST